MVGDDFQYSLGPPDSGFSLFLADRTKKVRVLQTHHDHSIASSSDHPPCRAEHQSSFDARSLTCNSVLPRSEVHFIRHAEGHHNAATKAHGNNTCLHRGAAPAREHPLWDSRLNWKGIEQAQSLRRYLAERPSNGCAATPPRSTRRAPRRLPLRREARQPADATRHHSPRDVSAVDALRALPVTLVMRDRSPIAGACIHPSLMMWRHARAVARRDYTAFDLVVVSPLTRTCETADHIFGPARPPGMPACLDPSLRAGGPPAPRILVREECRERWGEYVCDGRRPIREIMVEFPHFDWSECEHDNDIFYSDKREPDEEVSRRVCSGRVYVGGSVAVASTAAGFGDDSRVSARAPRLVPRAHPPVHPPHASVRPSSPRSPPHRDRERERAVLRARGRVPRVAQQAAGEVHRRRDALVVPAPPLPAVRREHVEHRPGQ